MHHCRDHAFDDDYNSIDELYDELNDASHSLSKRSDFASNVVRLNSEPKTDSDLILEEYEDSASHTLGKVCCVFSYKNNMNQVQD